MRRDRNSGVMMGRCVGVLLACGLVFGAGVVPASAADNNGGLWASSNTVIDGLHKDGIDGNGVKVALIGDTPVVNHPDLADAQITTNLAEFSQYSASGFTQGGSCMISGQQLTAEEKYSTRDVPVVDENGKQDGDKTTKEYVPDSKYTSVSTEALKWFAGSGTGYDGAKDVAGIAPRTLISTYAATGIDAAGCDTSGDTHTRVDVDATVYDAVKSGARVVDMQVTNPVSYDKYKGFMTALRHGTIIVNANTGATGAGSSKYTGDPDNPSLFPGVLMVSPVNPDGGIVGEVKNAGITVAVPGGSLLYGGDSSSRSVTVQDATNMAPAIMSAYLALMMQKYPTATGNQILQALVRSTANTDATTDVSTLEHNDSTGYGVIDLQRFYDTDPTTLPDINPILEAQVKNALNDSYAKRWLTQTCEKNPDGMLVDGSLTDVIACGSQEINAEYQRQVTAWAKVEQCEKDNGTNCMQYSATNTADAADADASGTATVEEDDDDNTGLSVRNIIIIAALALGVIIIVAGIILTLRKKKHGKTGDNGTHGKTHGKQHGSKTAKRKHGKHGSIADTDNNADNVDTDNIVDSDNTARNEYSGNSARSGRTVNNGSTARNAHTADSGYDDYSDYDDADMMDAPVDVDDGYGVDGDMWVDDDDDPRAQRYDDRGSRGGGAHRATSHRGSQQEPEYDDEPVDGYYDDEYDDADGYDDYDSGADADMEGYSDNGLDDDGYGYEDDDHATNSAGDGYDDDGYYDDGGYSDDGDGYDDDGDYELEEPEPELEPEPAPVRRTSPHRSTGAIRRQPSRAQAQQRSRTAAHGEDYGESVVQVNTRDDDSSIVFDDYEDPVFDMGGDDSTMVDDDNGGFPAPASPEPARTANTRTPVNRSQPARRRTTGTTASRTATTGSTGAGNTGTQNTSSTSAGHRPMRRRTR